MDDKSCRLILENGEIFEGTLSESSTHYCVGEVVFTTGMMGYTESLTDPSFAGQILVFTYPLIGNYGIPSAEHWESKHLHIHGVVVSQSIENWNHYQGLHSLADWLKLHHIPLLTGVDTRALTKSLRVSGTMSGTITHENSFQTPNLLKNENWVAHVSNKHKQTIATGKKTVIAVDCGIKENILRSLARFPLTIHRVPYDYDYTDEDYDGVLISNGPGDPRTCAHTISILKKALACNRPVFGICLGTQLMALAAGAKIYKLPYGHRGHNQPCIHSETNRCYVTSQNHGYAIDADTLSDEWAVSFRNLNDNSVEGIHHLHKPFFGVQFHPEASPGPTDTAWLFEKFYEAL